MVHAIDYPYDPIIDQEKHHLHSWVNEVYLDTPLVYSNSTKLEKYKVVK